jgi:hypothetical protein
MADVGRAGSFISLAVSILEGLDLFVMATGWPIGRHP